MTAKPVGSNLWRAASRPRFVGPALIDTHIWLWYLDGVSGDMSPDAVRLLQRACKGAGLLVSDISVWEVGNKISKGKLVVAPTFSLWLERAVRAPGFRFVPLDRDTLVASTQLTGTVHGDPADRMLIATAMLLGIPLITADRDVISYASAQGGFSVCDGRL